MSDVLMALLAGFIVGVFFSAIKLPIPAPHVLPGVIGIFGVYSGGIAYQWIVERFFT
jgi:XapX domain-containing protein